MRQNETTTKAQSNRLLKPAKFRARQKRRNFTHFFVHTEDSTGSGYHLKSHRRKAGSGPSMVGSEPGPDGHSQSRTTTFLLSNLHCASCVSNIEEALFRLVPRPTSVDPSIVSQTVTVRHHPSLPESTLSRALGDAGFEIYDMVRDAETEFIASDGSPNENALVEQDG